MENEIKTNDVVELMQVDSSNVVLAQQKAEIDIQIATAKQNPRDIHRAINDIVTWGTMDDETAQSCFYSLARNGSNGRNAVEGLSVRMAEVFVEAWGNIRAASKIVANDGKSITAQAVCFDLERNVAIQTEVKQRITDKNGRTYSEDMQITASNAACAKAFRNAVFKVIPKAITAKAVSDIKSVAMGKAVNMTETRSKIVASFIHFGIKEEQLLEYLEVKSRDEIDKDMVFHLRGIYNAIKEGDTTPEESILKTIKDRKQTAQAEKEAASNRNAAVAAAAMSFMES